MLHYPNDFKLTQKLSDTGIDQEAIMETVSIDLSQNYDLRASLDFEYDQGVFTLGFTESAMGEAG